MPSDIKSFILKEILAHPQDIVAITAKHFDVSRTTVHRHLNALCNQSKIIKTGTTKQIRYYLPNQQDTTFQLSINDKLTEGETWDKYVKLQFEDLSKNVYDIVHYGFTEMFNNAIDHSQGKLINVSITQHLDNVKFIITDNGIGLFKKINHIFHYEDYKECLLHLTKGKLTTDPFNHTGEGIFFTSRMFDKFILKANNLSFTRDNLIKDWTVEICDQPKGTQIILEISKKSKSNMIEVFNEYTEHEDFAFCKTDLLVDLSAFGEDTLISRSQAKRLLMNLEPFKTVTLDFSKIRTVGQGFVDEIFRVYILKNPQVKINYVNANQEVEFMIKRSIKD